MGVQGEPLSESVPGGVPEDERAVGARLLERARGGDREALGELLTRHRERLMRVVRVRLGPGMRGRLDASDVLQETFAAVIANPAGLRPRDEADLGRWLARVATNRIRDEHDRRTALRREAGRDVPLHPASGDASEGAGSRALADSATSPSGRAAMDEVREIVDGALAELPEDYREVIVLRDYCGLDWEHIATDLQRPGIHATQQLHQRAWIKLRKLAEPRLRGAG